MPNQSEQQLTSAIIKAVNASGLARVWRNQSGKVRVAGGFMSLSPAGTPDILGFACRGRAGVLVGLEVKLPGVQSSKANEAQEAWLGFAKAHGCITAVVRSAQEAIDVLVGDHGFGSRRTGTS